LEINDKKEIILSELETEREKFNGTLGRGLDEFEKGNYDPFYLYESFGFPYEFTEELAKEKGITLNVQLPQTLPRIYGSSLRLQQVVRNLISNAIKYSREGTVLVRAVEDDNDLRVEVIDSGIGILPEDLPLLFTDFFRGKNVETRGTGLGLSISKRIVEAHGGRIWAKSPCPETGKGSQFSFILPKGGAPQRSNVSESRPGIRFSE